MLVVKLKRLLSLLMESAMRNLFVFGLAISLASATSAQDSVINSFAQPIATTVQLPTFGVSFDADGVLQLNTHTDPTGQLVARRLAAARAALPGNLARAVPLRKISIVRLQAAVSDLIRDGKDPTEAMLNLAGLTRITSIFCYPGERDIVIAGPAEPWIDNLGDNAVGIHSGRPTLQLADLVVALRVYQPESEIRGFVGCTINPQAEGLRKMEQFQRTIPKVVPDDQRERVARWVSNGVQESLGMADVRVFGVPANTYFAQVMIEADYRMKRIAVGVEKPPVRMTTFASALKTAQHGTLQRWWFTPNYDGVLASPDRLAMQINGQGVQLQTENKVVLQDGSIADSDRKPSRATQSYAASFTQQYEDIARMSPVYAQLRQMMDHLIVAAFIRKHDWYSKANWNARDLLDESSFSVNKLNSPRTAPVVVNVFWKQRRLFVPAGGGVSIVAEKALAKMIDDENLAKTHAQIRPKDPKNWWWD